MKRDRAARIAHLEARIQTLEAVRPKLDAEVARARANCPVEVEKLGTEAALTNLRMAENQRAHLDTLLAQARRKLRRLQPQGNE